VFFKWSLSVEFREVKVIHFNGYTVNSVDTTGAGDAFLAGLLAYIAHDGLPQSVEHVRNALTQASACGALATTLKGALTALPDRHTLDAFIRQNALLEYETRPLQL